MLSCCLDVLSAAVYSLLSSATWPSQEIKLSQKKRECVDSKWGRVNKTFGSQESVMITEQSQNWSAEDISVFMPFPFAVTTTELLGCLQVPALQVVANLLKVTWVQALNPAAAQHDLSVVSQSV